MSDILKLPIDDFLPSILEKLSSENQNLVITASPGAGKTTRLPPALLAAVKGKVLVLEPRRMAAIAAAHRIAEENNWQVGQEIGYQVRFANKTSTGTRLIFMTEALLARQMIKDPELNGVDVVVLDEFHERSLHVDLTLGLLRELQELGRSIHLVIMSATLEAEKISAYLGNCAVVSVPGKLFELDIRYQKSNQLLQLQHGFYDNLFATIKEAQAQTSKDILVFLPGVGEIERALQQAEVWAESKKILLVRLHGSLPLDEQRQVLQKNARQRVIFSTNIAESSVTIDGVNTVIDSGLAKVMRQDLRTGFSRLELSRISLSSAIQRSGRAARQFPGISYRMWNKMDEPSFGKSEVPEILRSDLSESLLFLAAQGVHNFDQFMWFEKPSPQSLERALKTLRAAEALNAGNELTPIGEKLLQFPLPVRLARVVLAGQESDQVELAAKIVALLQERDILRKEAVSSFIGDQLECDLTARLETFERFLAGRNAQDLHRLGAQTAGQAYRQILSLSEGARKLPAMKKNFDFKEARQWLLLAAYKDRLCRRRKNSDRALMVGGRGVKLAAESLVKNSEFFIALQGVEGKSDAETEISLASGVEKEFLLRQFSDLIVRQKQIIFDEEKKQFYAQEQKVLWDLPLEEPSLSIATAAQVSEKLPEVLAHNWAMVLKENENLKTWWQKIIFLRFHRHFLSESQQTSLDGIFLGEALRLELRLEAFTQACAGHNKIAEVLAQNLVYFFENILPPDLQKTLQTELPSHLKVPSGSQIPIHYPADKAPFLEVRIQELFGWTKTPHVLFQKIPLVIHLLSPNFRPVQITSHLESFWQNAYPEVRKELRLKYPKHQWPENPADGIPEAKGRRR